jgi:hypothetical protein
MRTEFAIPTAEAPEAPVTPLDPEEEPPAVDDPDENGGEDPVEEPAEPVGEPAAPVGDPPAEHDEAGIGA